MPSSKLVIYKASAGSGKTFTLAVEYITLLMRNPYAYREILAVTFTNKATAEMKERILSQLYGIAINDDSSASYVKALQQKLPYTAAELSQKAGAALANIIHDYSRFKVETIDSFFQSVMRNLTRELGLGASLNIELNNSDVLSDAVDSMIEKMEPNSPLLGWLTDYIKERIAEGKRWNVSNEVKAFGRTIFDEAFLEKGVALRQKLTDKHYLQQYQKQLRALQKEGLEQMKEFSTHFEEVLEGANLMPNDLKNGSKGIGSYFRKLAAGDLTDKVRNKTVEACLEAPENWSSKTSASKVSIIELASNELIGILTDAETFRSKNNLIVNSCRLSLNHLNKVGLLNDIANEVKLLNSENNRFLLSDTSSLLRSIIRDEDSSFVFEKIGVNIHHVMIDEFQDTSKMQWDNFRLLLLEGLAQGRDSLIVGDVKQSIYRWRSGDWRILSGLKSHIDHFPIEQISLSTNWRSCKNVITFNNQLFQNAQELLGQAYEAEFGDLCVALQEAYQDVVQQAGKSDESGHVSVHFISKTAEATYDELTLQLLIEQVEVLQDAGVKPADIAILVRKNRSIPAIAEAFGSYKQANTSLQSRYCYDIISDEAFRMDASPAILILIQAIRWLANPKDTIVLVNLITGYQHDVLQAIMPINELFLHPSNQLLPAQFVDRKESLLLLPLYELLEEVYLLFELEKIEKQDAYLFAFYDAVNEYLQTNSSDLSRFILFWEQKLAQQTIPFSDVDGIRILSIHKSKGLEFHSVLVPYCDWKMENETTQLVWCTPTVDPYNQLDLLPINYSSIMRESIYNKEYQTEKLQLWVDNLNLLYVAFTRAECNLIVFANGAKKGSVSELLWNALNAQNAQLSEESPVYSFGVLSPSIEKIAQTSSNKLLQSPTMLPLTLCSTPCKVTFKQSNRSASFIQNDLLANTRSSYIEYGQLLHTLFGQLSTSSDIEKVVEQLFMEGVIESVAQKEQLTLLARRALNDPQVASWYAGNYTLYNECAILYKEQGVVQTKRPDRVMVGKKEVIVVDLKFGKKQASHQEQVKGYMDLLSQMGEQEVKGYLWYVLDGLVVAV